MYMKLLRTHWKVCAERSIHHVFILDLNYLVLVSIFHPFLSL
jgi:hypothetical protein